MLKTPLNQWHHANGGRMVDFAGWEMPVQYSSIVEEHNTVRQAVGLFDISHMGRLQFSGSSAGSFLNSVLTNDTERLKPGDIRYSLICRHDGGILDDVLIYRLPDRWLLVVNASNREKITAWLQQQPGFAESQMTDLTLQTAMIAVQGPSSVQLVEELWGGTVRGMKYYTGADLTVGPQKVLVSRTGYTGEDGFELTVSGSFGETLWQQLLDMGSEQKIAAAGLGCRDTLRLEAGMPLYGHELSESIDPLTAGLNFAVRLQKAGFIGQEAIRQIRENGPSRVRVGLILEGRRIARENTPILGNTSQPVGWVTSGTFSPTLQQSIAMAYVDPEYGTEGVKLTVELRGTEIPASVVRLPFYSRATA